MIWRGAAQAIADYYALQHAEPDTLLMADPETVGPLQLAWGFTGSMFGEREELYERNYPETTRLTG